MPFWKELSRPPKGEESFSSSRGQSRHEKGGVGRQGDDLPISPLVTSRKLSEIGEGVVLEVICEKSETTVRSIIAVLKRRGCGYEVLEEGENYVIKVYKC